MIVRITNELIELPQYEIDEYGNIFNKDKKRYLRPQKIKSGKTHYYAFNLCGTLYYLHRLMWWSFEGIIDDTINHIDHNKINNHISNLEEMSRSENSIDCHQNREDYKITKSYKHLYNKYSYDGILIQSGLLNEEINQIDLYDNRRKYIAFREDNKIFKIYSLGEGLIFQSPFKIDIITYINNNELNIPIKKYQSFFKDYYTKTDKKMEKNDFFRSIYN